MLRRPPRSTRTDTRFPCPTLLRSLVQVLDRGVTAAHVAVDRRVPDRVLALVAGSQHQPAELVAQRHQQRAAGARLQVLLGGVGLAALERAGQRIEEALERLLDRQRQQPYAQRVALLLRQVVGQPCRVARRRSEEDTSELQSLK